MDANGPELPFMSLHCTASQEGLAHLSQLLFAAGTTLLIGKYTAQAKMAGTDMYT
jgi:hypothetical protein